MFVLGEVRELKAMTAQPWYMAVGDGVCFASRMLGHGGGESGRGDGSLIIESFRSFGLLNHFL